MEINRMKAKEGLSGRIINPKEELKRLEKHESKAHEQAKDMAKKMKGGHKQGEREVRSKKAGFYVQGHKNYGDVYEA